MSISSSPNSVIYPGSNELVFDGTYTFANSASPNTVANSPGLNITLPSSLQRNATYLVTITNPSSATAITVKIQNKETNWGGSDLYPELHQYAVQASTPSGRPVMVEGWLLGSGGRIVISNDTGLGISAGFTGLVRVRKV